MGSVEWCTLATVAMHCGCLEMMLRWLGNLLQSFNPPNIRKNPELLPQSTHRGASPKIKTVDHVSSVIGEIAIIFESNSHIERQFSYRIVSDELES